MTSIPDLRAVRSRSRWHSAPREVVNGCTHPCLMVFDGSGMALVRSTPMVLPKPRQFEHAPRGELNENRDVVGGRRVNPVLGLVQ